MQLTIQQINRKPITTKYGDTNRVSILTQEYNDKWLSGFEDDINKSWNVNMVVEATVTQNSEYLNFKAIRPSVTPNMSTAQAPPPDYAPKPIEKFAQELNQEIAEDKEEEKWNRINQKKNVSIKKLNAINNATLLIAHGQYPIDKSLVQTIEDLAKAIYGIKINGD